MRLAKLGNLGQKFWDGILLETEMGEFKGDRDDLGARLRRQREAGVVGMARRYVEGPAERAAPEVRVERARAAVREAEAGRRRGRPKVEGERPWEAAGVSRTEWYRRLKAAKEGGG